MKKNIISLLVIIAPFLLYAQPYSNKDKMLISARVDTLLQKYMQKNTLTEPGSTHQNPKVVKEFKSLFTSDAKIFDDINASFDENEAGYPYKLREKSLNEYYTGLIEEFATGLIITNKRINISYDNFDKGEVSAALQRNITGTNSKKYDLANEDTLLIKISIQPDKSVKIKSIASLGNTQVKIVNDDDLDGVINNLDECRGQKGKINLNGCPDRDGDGVPDKRDDCEDTPGPKENNGCPPTTFAYTFVLSGSIGFQLNLNGLKVPEDGFGYDLDNNGNSFGDIKNPSFSGSPSLNANIAYYFGKKKQNKNKGISFGFSATHYSAIYELSKIKYIYKANDYPDKTGDPYHRIVTMHDGGTEKLSYSILNFPLLLKYKARFGQRMAFELGAGPSFISFITKSEYNAVFDFEGIYEYANGDINYTKTYDINSAGSPDLLETGNGIYGDLFNADPNTHYDDLLPDYDFHLDVPVSGDAKVKARYAVAFNANADIFYHIAATVAIKAGFALVFTPSIKGNKDAYILMDKSYDSYRSIYDSNAKSTYTSFGLNFGIILGI
jgi:hypothetical protein